MANNTNIVSVNHNTSVYVPFGGKALSLGSEAIAPSPEYPLLQYATGLPAQKPKFNENGIQLYDEDTGEALYDNVYYAGFFTECDKDKALDAAMTEKKVPYVFISHGNGEVKKHWAVQKPTVFLLAMGIPGNAHSDGELGMVYQWRAKRNSTKSESVFYAQVIVRQLLPMYSKPFVITLKSTQTLDILSAIKRQFKVLRRAHEELQRLGQDIELPLWAYSLPLGASKKQEMRGSEGAQKPIYPLMALVPDEVDTAYLQRHEVPMEHVELLQEATEKSVQWSTALSQRITSGTETGEAWQQGTQSGMADSTPL